MKELIIVLAILVAGYGGLALYFRHDCRKVEYIEKDIGRGEDNGLCP